MDPYPEEGSKAVMVLGSGRSGTSTVTRMLHVLGFDLGPESCMMRPTPANPKGYFELVPVVRFHNELLAALGGGAFDPPDLPKGWARDSRLQGLRDRLRGLVKALFGPREDWVVKDPRLSFLLPLWMETFQGLSCIVALRNPLDVAASLQRSDGVPFSKAVAYWERAVTSALSASTAASRLLLFYEDLMQDPEGTFLRIARFTGRAHLAALPEVRALAAAFLEGRLHRHRSSPEAVLDHPDLPFRVKALYLALRLGVDGEDADKSRLLDRFAGQCEAERTGDGEPSPVETLSCDSRQGEGSQKISPSLSVVIPVFNALPHVKRCMEALLRNTPATPPFEVILVDNGSDRETADYLQALAGTRHAVRLITLGRNLGFARACNRGARAAQGGLLLFLNSDTEVTPGWLSPLRRALEKERFAVAAGPRLLYPDGTIQCAGVVLVEDRLRGDPLAARPLFKGRPGDLPDALRPRAFQALTAACLLVKRAAFEAAGGFDEGYWNGYEDVDLCLRLGAREGKLLYIPSSVVIHHEAQSGAERYRKVGENVARFHAAWLGRVQADYVILPEGAEEETSERVEEALPLQR